jgi:hypothetical protein
MKRPRVAPAFEGLQPASTASAAARGAARKGKQSLRGGCALATLPRERLATAFAPTRPSRSDFGVCIAIVCISRPRRTTAFIRTVGRA